MTMSPWNSFSLENYGYNLTQIARQGMFHPLKNYDAVVARIFDVLLRKEKTRLHYNPLLLDDDETCKWQVALEVVRRLAIGEAPASLLSLQVIAPNFTALCGVSPSATQHNATETVLAGEEQLTQLFSWPPDDTWDISDEVLSRFKTFFAAVSQTEGQVLLLLNDFHRLVSIGPQLYSIDLMPWLIPYLARREIQLLGMSTLAHYRPHIEHIAAIECRVQMIGLRSNEELQQKRDS